MLVPFVEGRAVRHRRRRSLRQARHDDSRSGEGRSDSTNAHDDLLTSRGVIAGYGVTLSRE
jgi:hypothetical protein